MLTFPGIFQRRTLHKMNVYVSSRRPINIGAIRPQTNREVIVGAVRTQGDGSSSRKSDAEQIAAFTGMRRQDESQAKPVTYPRGV
ncbi:hypothetical protein C2E23DRAFT_507851 [Lenzites betulinus]|nr:hypothetical protein C2E23DRAFT_507851 [Lenzites betulinus]